MAPAVVEAMHLEVHRVPGPLAEGEASLSRFVSSAVTAHVDRVSRQQAAMEATTKAMKKIELRVYGEVNLRRDHQVRFTGTRLASTDYVGEIYQTAAGTIVLWRITGLMALPTRNSILSRNCARPGRIRSMTMNRVSCGAHLWPTLTRLRARTSSSKSTKNVKRRRPVLKTPDGACPVTRADVM